MAASLNFNLIKVKLPEKCLYLSKRKTCVIHSRLGSSNMYENDLFENIKEIAILNDSY